MHPDTLKSLFCFFWVWVWDGETDSVFGVDLELELELDLGSWKGLGGAWQGYWPGATTITESGTGVVPGGTGWYCWKGNGSTLGRG